MMYGFVYFLLAGTVGALAAVLFYVGAYFLRRRHWLTFIFAIVIPVILLVVSLTDFTEKQNWEAIQGKTSFASEFTYFHGERQIPLELKKGDILTFKVAFHLKNDGGWGYRLQNKKERLMSMTRDGDRNIFESPTDGTYYIVINGTKAKGNVVVDWDISTDGL